MVTHFIILNKNDLYKCFLFFRNSMETSFSEVDPSVNEETSVADMNKYCSF